MNDVDTGALGASGRFARMEAALDRIEAKLDLKADVTTVARVEGRVSAVETLISDLSSGKIVTPISQIYLQRFGEMERSIEDLESKDKAKVALVASAKESADRRYVALSWVVGVALIFNVLLAASTAFGLR